jgi:hypothetical protein
MKLAFIMYLKSQGLEATMLKMFYITRGRMPIYDFDIFFDDDVPIVKVFPLPVWP